MPPNNLEIFKGKRVAVQTALKTDPFGKEDIKKKAGPLGKIKER